MLNEEKTLEDKEITEVMNSLIKNFQKELDASIVIIINQNIIMKNIILALFAVITLVSCRSGAGFSSKQEVVTNTKSGFWQIMFLAAKFLLKYKTKRISGNGGCNNYFAEAMVNASNGIL